MGEHRDLVFAVMAPYSGSTPLRRLRDSFILFILYIETRPLVEMSFLRLAPPKIALYALDAIRRIWEY